MPSASAEAVSMVIQSAAVASQAKVGKKVMERIPASVSTVSEVR